MPVEPSRHGLPTSRPALTPPSDAARAWRAVVLATFVGASIDGSGRSARRTGPGRRRARAGCVDDALAANLELRAGSASVEQRLAALDQARARYLPVLDFAARYSVADGGRTIDFPAGDLLNPVYATLDQMLRRGRAAAALPARSERGDRRCCVRTSRRRSSSSSSRSTSRGSGRASKPAAQELDRAEADLAACAPASCATCARPITSGSPRSRRSRCSSDARRWPAPTSTRTRACIATAGSRATSSIAPKPTCSRSSSSGSPPRAAFGSRRAT